MDKEKTEDERFEERLTWNQGDIEILEVPEKSKEEVEKLNKHEDKEPDKE